MNHFTHKQQIAQGIFIAFSLLASLAGAADLSTQKLRASSSVSDVVNAAQPNAVIQNSTASPVATEAQTKKAITQPGITQPALTPGAAQSLNPQPLPPGGGLIKPMPGSSIDMAKPRIDSGIKASPGLIQPATGTLGQAATPGVRPGMEDRAIIIVGGKSLTMGELKKNLFADIAAKAGPPKTIKSSARKLDFAQPTPQNTMQRSTGGGKKSSLSAKSESLVSLPGKDMSRLKTDAQHVSISEMRCPNNGKGPPKISEIQGKLIVGKRVTVWGECFGDRTGRVEIIGPFPGGKLNPAFVSWDQNSIEFDIPSVRGATDSDGATLTVVTADGKTSAPMQAQFVAARERIEVPDRLWSPNASFELSSAENTYANANKASHGQLAKSLRINPQCALETMDVVILSGGVTAINGWEQPGPPNEAAVTLDWVGTCTGTTIKTTYTSIVALGDDVSFTSACRVAFQTRAWAYCPVGVAP